jgi:hypothetical protein
MSIPVNLAQPDNHSLANCYTFIYKTTGTNLDLKFDLYLPASAFEDVGSGDEVSRIVSLGAVVFFHGGGLTVGNRKSWFPNWLCRMSNHSFYA